METIIHALLCWLALYLVCVVFRHIKTHKILVVEDSPTEVIAMKNRLQMPNCKFEWKDSIESISFVRLWIFKPHLVIVDQNLKGPMKGVELVKHYRSYEIPAVLATADNGSIAGITEEYIMRKSSGDKFYSDLLSWMKTELKIV